MQASRIALRYRRVRAALCIVFTSQLPPGRLSTPGQLRDQFHFRVRESFHNTSYSKLQSDGLHNMHQSSKTPPWVSQTAQSRSTPPP